MARPVKCKGCGKQDEKEKMVKVEKVGYFHLSKCHDEYLQHKEFKRLEAEKLDKLYKYILELHSLIVVPTALITRIQELRNGTIIQGGKKVKQYKQGVSYDLIYDAYLLATDSIKWCITNKLNNSNDIKALNYCFSIMQSKINEAWAREQQLKKTEEHKEKLKTQTTIEVIQQHDYKKPKKDELDISDLIGG